MGGGLDNGSNSRQRQQKDRQFRRRGGRARDRDSLCVVGACQQRWRNQNPFEYSACCEFVLVLPSPRRYTGALTLHNQTEQVTSPAHWASVKIALIKSMRTGVFFDRKYWARHSKSGDALKPVYFSSIIMSDKVQQLNNCTSNYDYGSVETLTVPSGKIPQGTERSNQRLGGRRQRRK